MLSRKQFCCYSRIMQALEVEDDNDEDETVGLMGRPGKFANNTAINRDSSIAAAQPRQRWKVGVVAMMMLCLVVVLYVSQRPRALPQRPQEKEGVHNTLELSPEDMIHQANNTNDKAVIPPRAKNDGKEDESSSAPSSSLFQCPKVQSSRAPENIATAATEHEAWYEAVSRGITNVTTYLQTFRQTEFDNWGHSFEQVQRGMYQWKSKRFTPHLKSGDTIYESACGIGMNLYMTLEILSQVSPGLTNLTVFGNEYVPKSVDIARTIARGGSLPAGGRLGTICAADSTQLDFVPSNAFDLVYTGYISPLFDPLLLNQSTDENFAQYGAHCEEDSQLAAKAQQRQNDWYAAWVGEMIRIAKPGAPVIVEQVSFP